MTPSSSPSHSRAIGNLLWRFILAACVIISGVGAFASEAAAQSITIGTFYERRSDRPDGIKTTLINRDDCLANDTITFTTTSRGVTSSGAAVQLVVYASTNGADCAVSTQARPDLNGQCWKVKGTDTITGSFEIPVADIIKPPEGGKELCSAWDYTNVTLFFLLMEADAVKASNKVTFTYDMIGPKPPSGVKMGVGENRLYPSWSVSTASTEKLRGFYVYCDKADEIAQDETGVGGDTGTNATSGGATTAQAGATPSSSGGSTSGSESSCTNANLIPGEPPPSELRKGQLIAVVAGRSEATGLENGVRYACGVATVDDSLNIGVLSELACGTPQQIDGYFDRYRQAGGTAGGGICTFGRQPAGVASGLAALSGLLLVIRRRRSAAVRGSR